MNRIAMLAAVLAACLPHTAGAGDGHAATVAADDPLKARIEAAALARELIAYARDHRDTRAMLVAASVLGRAGVVIDAAGNAPIIDVDSLHAEARAIAHGDPALLDAVAQAQAGADKGLLPNAITFEAPVPGGERWSMQARVEANRQAQVRAKGDGDANVALTVLDDRGHVACATAITPFQREPVCRWTPLRAGNYRIELRNTSRVSTNVILATN